MKAFPKYRLNLLKNSKIQNILRKRKEEADILNKQQLKQKQLEEQQLKQHYGDVVKLYDKLKNISNACTCKEDTK